MSLNHDRTIKLLQKLKTQSQTHSLQSSCINPYQFFQSLLYGKSSLTQQFGIFSYSLQPPHIISRCTLYLHENHIDLLIVNNNNNSQGFNNNNNNKYFNLRQIQVYSFNGEIQMDKNVQNRYLLIEEQQDKIVLIFKNQQKRDQFKLSLINLKKRLLTLSTSYNSAIIKAFVKTDINQNEQISYQQLKELFKSMNITMNSNVTKFLQKILKKQKIQENTTIYSHDFQKIWKIVYCRLELMPVFMIYCNDKNTIKDKSFMNYEDYLKPMMSVQKFIQFLKQSQQQCQVQCKKILKRLSLHHKQSRKLSFYQFSLFIFDSSNLLMSKSYQCQKTPQTYPLTQYYCYSSHNTYLTGNQLTSMSKGERYFQDLYHGLRCVQIDIHDGDNQPVVKHGYTLTSTIKFQQVIMFINKFTEIQKNHTPIILSLEIHVNVQNQRKIAEILKKVFNDRILLVDHQKKQFPTLKQCRGKIIIKGPGSYQALKQISTKQENKLLMSSISQQSQIVMIDQIVSDQDQQCQDDIQQNNLENVENQLQEHDDQIIKQFYDKRKAFYSEIKQLKQKNKKFKQKKKQFNRIKLTTLTVDSFLKGQLNKVEQNKFLNINNIKPTNKKLKHQQNQKHGQPFSVSLLKLTTLLSKKKLSSQQLKSPWQSNSFSQRKIQQYLSFHKPLMQKLSSLQWFRSYPGGFRVNSSNYNPIPAMQLGVQIIAMNTQKQNDIYNNIMRSFFRKGRQITTGYRQKNISSSIHNNSSISKRCKTYIELQFISALRIYFNQPQQSIPNVVILAYFIGTDQDQQLNQYYTKKRVYTNIIQGNSFNPIFNQSKIIKLEISNLQLGFVVVEIQNCGRNVIPLDCLKNGYRTIGLMDARLKQKQSKVLCKIKKNK